MLISPPYFVIMCSMAESSTFSCRYTAVGVFVLGRLFREAWGKEAPKMQSEFNDFLEVLLLHFHLYLSELLLRTLVCCSSLYCSDRDF